ncbi:MAG: hypothetical protein IJ087_20695 [Eggerthellaceae bacterium]|nr:hypothetical protein [Eggerthellaceae bacterium]
MALGISAHYREKVVKTALGEQSEMKDSQWLSGSNSMISTPLNHWKSRKKVR